MTRQATIWDRLSAVDVRVWDALLVLALLAVEVAAVGGGPGGIDEQDDLGAALVILTTTLPLVWRRRAPFAVAVLVSVAVAGSAAVGFSPSVALSLSVAAFTAGAAISDPVRLALTLGLAVCASALLGVPDLGAAQVLTGAVLRVGVPAALGWAVADRRRWRDRAAASAAEAAVGAERARIARELHDVVVHAVGVMVVQAGGARAVLDRDPQAATAALRQVEEAGRAGIGELRRLLGSGPDQDGRVPLAGLDRLDELVDGVRAAGQPVEVVVEGDPVPLPSGVDLAAYRIVQEALTNALAHAAGARTRVRLRYAADHVEVEVADDGAGGSQGGTGPPLWPGGSQGGPGPPLGFAGSQERAASPLRPDGADSPARGVVGGGRGLVGMRERIALYGGDLDAGPGPGGGFTVRARLPLGGAS